MRKSKMSARNRIIEDLFRQGCTSTEIVSILKDKFSVTLSLRQVQRILGYAGLNERRNESPIEQIVSAIMEEVGGPGELLGYRSIWYRLRYKYGLSVRRNIVMRVLRTLNPEASAQRRSRRLKRRIYRNKGPNFLWHCDGYDKLKPYGLCIHGCIDGYSRKILWLKVSSSNNNPAYIADFYAECVRLVGGSPYLLRTDLGTENSSIAVMQSVLRHIASNGTQDGPSHIYGKSTSNQRIEAWWSQLRRSFSEWWINFFKEMVMNGHIQGCNPFHKDAVRFCFGPLIQMQLDEFVDFWNKHRIRKSRMSEQVAGVPNVLYDHPELKGVSDYKCLIDIQSLAELEKNFCEDPNMIINSDFAMFANTVMDTFDLSNTDSFEQCLELYFLLQEIQ